jgi:phosphoglycolate phosphatase-like HAD superfamily hydrolase
VTAFLLAALDMGGTTVDDSRARVQAVYEVFAGTLDESYRTTPPVPVPGVLDMFETLHQAGVKIALQTGHSAPVANSIMTGLGWTTGETVHACVTSDCSKRTVE